MSSLSDELKQDSRRDMVVMLIRLRLIRGAVYDFFHKKR